MHTKKLKDYIFHATKLPEHEWARTQGCIVEKHYKKGTTIHQSGKLFNTLLFINNGLARSYLTDDEGKEFTWSIHFNDATSKIENLFMTDFANLIHPQTNQLQFEALENTTVVEIKKDDLHSWYRESHAWANTGRIITEAAYCFTRNRSLSLLSKTATQRYIDLKQEKPSFVEKASQYHIASYLGITPQSLSRIKKELGVCRA